MEPGGQQSCLLFSKFILSRAGQFCPLRSTPPSMQGRQTQVRCCVIVLKLFSSGNTALKPCSLNLLQGSWLSRTRPSAACCSALMTLHALALVMFVI